MFGMRGALVWRMHGSSLPRPASYRFLSSACGNSVKRTDFPIASHSTTPFFFFATSSPQTEPMASSQKNMWLPPTCGRNSILFVGGTCGSPLACDSPQPVAEIPLCSSPLACGPPPRMRLPPTCGRNPTLFVEFPGAAGAESRVSSGLRPSRRLRLGAARPGHRGKERPSPTGADVPRPLATVGRAASHMKLCRGIGSAHRGRGRPMRRADFPTLRWGSGLRALCLRLSLPVAGITLCSFNPQD